MSMVQRDSIGYSCWLSQTPARMVSCENQACPVAPATDAFDTEEQAVAAWNRWLDTARAVLAEVDKEAKREG